MADPTADRCDGDRGVALVEFALVLPVLMMLLLGMFSGANAWNQNQALGQGARVAARYASTLPLPDDVPLSHTTPTMQAWLDGVALRAIGGAEGQMGTGAPGRAVCVSHVDPPRYGGDDDIPEAATRRLNANGTVTYDDTVCFDDHQGDASRVQVLLERSGYLDIGFYRQPLSLERTVVYRFEADGGL